MDIKKYKNLNGVSFITLPQYRDDRGFFTPFANFTSLLEGPIVQMNTSLSYKGVLRGMHHQINKPQGKLVTCVSGCVLDMVYDNRKESLTYGESGVFLLDSPNKFLYVPRGYLHGFISLADDSIFQYYIDNEYDPKDEETISWKIMEGTIPWDILHDTYSITKNNLIISDKDNI